MIHSCCFFGILIVLGIGLSVTAYFVMAMVDDTKMFGIINSQFIQGLADFCRGKNNPLQIPYLQGVTVKGDCNGMMYGIR